LTPNRPYYEIVRELLAANIRSGRLPAGVKLFASAVADRLGVSRPPVKRALKLLEEEELVHHTAEHGYVVGPANSGSEPAKLNLHQLNLELFGTPGATLVQPRWERIFEIVEEDILSCMPFGAYQVSEAALGEHFGVSRTVVRDVMSRMHGRGIIAKDRSSHWVAGPLGARVLDDAHEIRRLLEPSALAAATSLIKRDELLAMREKVRLALERGADISQDAIDDFETDLHIRCLEPVRNRRLFEAVRLSQISLVINRLFGTYIGVHDETDMLLEHRLVFDHATLGDREGAMSAMRHHLDADHQRSRARLKALSVFGEPEVAPYLVRIH
jgi:DNA-binding GntR family transcriptional regulator